MKVIVLSKRHDIGVKLDPNDSNIVGILTLDGDVEQIKQFTKSHFVYFLNKLKNKLVVGSEVKLN